MPVTQANADIYAAQRINIFFPGVIPELDGQCVSLVKWFMQEMSEVPNPQAARGDARYVGRTLVNQGHATEVPYSERRRGDIITYEYGVYGHIGVVLSGDRTFEENVNWAGVSSKIVDGLRVYASRIGSLSEAWRHDQHIYRLKTYKEGGMANEVMTPVVNHGDLVNMTSWLFLGQQGLDPGAEGFIGYDWKTFATKWITGGKFTEQQKRLQGQDALAKLLLDERDNVLYPYVNEISAALGVAANASPEGLQAALDAITKLKEQNPQPVEPTVLEKGDYRVLQ